MRAPKLVTEQFHYVGWPEATGFEDGARFDLGGVSVDRGPRSGHTGGHCVYLVASDDGSHRTVITGDIDLSAFGPYYGDATSDLDAFEASLARARQWTPGTTSRSTTRASSRATRRSCSRSSRPRRRFPVRESALIGLLEEPRTLTELCDIGIVYRPGTTTPVFGRRRRAALDRTPPGTPDRVWQVVAETVSDGTRYRLA